MLLGLGVGELAGGGVDGYMHRQKAKRGGQLQNTGVTVTRMGDDLVLIMPGSVTFDLNQSDLKPGFLPVLDSVSLILKAHLQTLINISGHADSTVSMALNLDLSGRRAQSVANYLPGTGVEQARIETLGFGPRFPVANKTTANGRQLNRRVELFPKPIVRGSTLVDRSVICIDAVCVTKYPFGWINCG